MKVLFITYDFYPKPLANAICARYVGDELKQSGCDVDYLVYKTNGPERSFEFDGSKIFFIAPPFRQRLFNYARYNSDKVTGRATRMLASFMTKTKKLLYIHWFPLDSILFPHRICKRLSKMRAVSQYDAIVTTFAPFDVALAGYWYKKRNADCCWILYALDSFVNKRQTFLPERIRDSHFWLNKFAAYADLLIYMESRHSYFVRYENNSSPCNVLSADIPLLRPLDDGQDSQCRTPDGLFKWAYAGSLGAPHYQTDDLIDTFLYLSEKNPLYQLHFFSSGDEAYRLRRKFNGSGLPIYVHDYISHDELIKRLDEFDVMVSLKYSDQISAKIFDYISRGKPIIHFSGNRKDPDKAYLLRYEGALVLDVTDKSTQDLGERCLRWTSETRLSNRLACTFETLEKNRPDYTAKLILDTVRRVAINKKSDKPHFSVSCD